MSRMNGSVSLELGPGFDREDGDLPGEVALRRCRMFEWLWVITDVSNSGEWIEKSRLG